MGTIKKHAGGRPTIMTPLTINKLEEAFALGASDLEACFYAGISHETLYSYQRDHPEFLERKESLKQKPILLARQTVVKSLKYNPEMAMRFLERKLKSEFSPRAELTGAEGTALVPTNITEEEQKKLLSLLKKKK